ncbi:MAG: hypothetical protein QF548_01550 [Acidimicrobiales bacterium]|jgi:hypothetical protein|nr:hypothetical protein [Acidimicrobiales bacterium]
MTTHGADRFTTAQVEAFAADGVVHVPGAVDTDLIDEVLALADRELAHPGPWVTTRPTTRSPVGFSRRATCGVTNRW